MVPLLLAVMLFFWFIAFMGGANDNLHTINKVENLQHLQEKLLYSAMKYRYEVKVDNPKMSDSELDLKVNQYINNMMRLNNIE